MMNLDQFKQNDKFLMFAFDHRGSFKKLMNPANADLVSDEQATALKKEIIDAVADQFSSILIDIPTGLPAYPSKTKPILLPIEKSGYLGEETARLNELEHTAAELKSLGAAAVKLLIYFNPSAATADKQLATSQQVLEDCHQNGLPLFLEIVAYGNKPSDKQDLVIPSLERFLAAGIKPDVYKLGYPGSQAASQQITEMLGDLPWIVLTGGEPFETFVEQLQAATTGGTQGFLAGRALWQEVCTMQGEDKDKFLTETLPNRFKQIVKISTSL